MKPIRRFIQYYSPYKTLFFLDLLCAVILSAVDLAFPQLLNILTGGLFTQSADRILSVLGLLAVGLVVMYLIRTFCQFFVTSYGHWMGTWMEKDMRREH